MVPTVELPPTVPSTSHVTPVFVVPETVALNCCFCFKVTGARRGTIVTVTTANDEIVRPRIVRRKASLASVVRMDMGPPWWMGDERFLHGLSAACMRLELPV